MPNSLIFAVILAVWAVYLIQHWIRRRDHVATARSVDRFSEAMRVLERRQSMPRADLSVPTPRSYSLSLTRPAHPDVVVKRAQPRQSAPAARRRKVRVSMPSVRVRRALALVLGVLGLAAGTTLTALGHLPTWGALTGVGALLLSVTYIRFSVGVQRRRAASPVRLGGRPVQARPAGSAEERRRERTVRQTSARSVPASQRAAQEKAQEKAQKRLARKKAQEKAQEKAQKRLARKKAQEKAQEKAREKRRQKVARRKATRTSTRTRPVRALAPKGALPQDAEHATRGTTESAAPAAAATEHAPAASRAAGVARAPREVYDGAAVEARTTPVAGVESGPELQFEQEPGTWSPVPVPPPTYTLKARAPRQVDEAPAAGTAGGRAPVGTPVEDLPFDGHALALDEEFEELPAVHRVG